jgi:hypothetical protein
MAVFTAFSPRIYWYHTDKNLNQINNVLLFQVGYIDSVVKFLKLLIIFRKNYFRNTEETKNENIIQELNEFYLHIL